MAYLLLIRGLPGSGKTTYAKQLAPAYSADHYEADMFFVDPVSGEYKYDGTKQGGAHEWCQMMVRSALEAKSNAVVSNTLTSFRELNPYLDMAEEGSHRVHVVECTEQFGSSHGLSEDILERMGARWETNRHLEARTIITHPFLYKNNLIRFTTNGPDRNTSIYC